MIDHRWLPPREAVALGRRAPARTADARWREETPKGARRRPPEDAAAILRALGGTEARTDG